MKHIYLYCLLIMAALIAPSATLMAQTSDVDLVFSDTSAVNLIDNQLVISAGHYALYNLQGLLIRQGNAPTRIPLQPNTVYILRLNNQSLKFITR